MIANIVIAATAFVAVLALADLFLAEHQKRRFSNQAVAAWDRIDEMTRFPLATWWREGPRWKWAITLLCCFFFAYAWTLPHPSGQEPIRGPPWLVFAFYMMISVFIARWIIDYVLPMLSPPPTSVVFWLFPVALGVLTIFGFLGLVRFSPPPVTLVATISAMLAFFGSMGIFAWAIAALPLLVVYAFAATLSTLEYLLRRIAEYPRGPILAISIIVGSIAGVLKVFL